VLPRQFRKVDWQAVATPDELQVVPSLRMRKTLEDAPEALDYFVRVATVIVASNRLEPLNTDFLRAARSHLDRLRRQVRDHAELALKDLVDALLNGLDLLSPLGEAFVKDERDELFNAVFGDSPLLAAFAKDHLVAI